MRFVLASFTLAVLLAVLGPRAGRADESAAPPAGVSDPAGRIRRDAVRWIEANCAALQGRKQVKLVVHVVPELSPGGGPAAAVARKAFEERKLGERGLLLLLLPESNEARLEAGSALAARYPEAQTAALLARSVVPALKAGDPSGAAMVAVADVMAGFGVTPVDPVFGGDAPRRPRRQSMPVFTVAAIVLFFLGLFVVDPDWRAMVMRKKKASSGE